MEDYILTYSIVTLIVAAGMAFIPANIAKKRGIVLACGGFMDGCSSLWQSFTSAAFLIKMYSRYLFIRTIPFRIVSRQMRDKAQQMN